MACQGFLTRLLAACQGSRHSHRQRGGRGSEAVPGVSVLGRGPAPPRAEQCGGLLGPILLQHPQRTAGTPQVLPLCEPCWLSSSCWAWLCVKGWFWSYWSVLGGWSCLWRTAAQLDSAQPGGCSAQAEWSGYNWDPQSISPTLSGKKNESHGISVDHTRAGS